MEIEIIPCLNDNYSYLIFNKIKKNACVIDPSEAKPIIEIIENAGFKMLISANVTDL